MSDLDYRITRRTQRTAQNPLAVFGVTWDKDGKRTGHTYGSMARAKVAYRLHADDNPEIIIDFVASWGTRFERQEA
ncbi:MAG: hypothetical protein ACSLE9_07800 [Burkholderiaceae bacterium]